ncbi:MAG: hypothetical protein HQM09_19900 [Candidatus Riflebacteria bacterium]|nr:hypothetical protein [Candidatus Riflebacteria bacterium]
MMIYFASRRVFVVMFAWSLFLPLFMPATGIAQTRNPLSQYISNLLDETSAEKAIGNLLEEAFRQECIASGPERLIASSALEDRLKQLAALTPRPALPYRLLVLKSPIPGEIPFPGGLVVVTEGILSLTQTPEERTFLLARNLMHVALRHPLTAMKREGLYARALKLLKQTSDHRDNREMRLLLRDYIKAAAGMDQQRADREAIALLPDEPGLKAAAIGLLERCSQALWPAMPWDWFDLSGRIDALKQ